MDAGIIGAFGTHFQSAAQESPPCSLPRPLLNGFLKQELFAPHPSFLRPCPLSRFSDRYCFWQFIFFRGRENGTFEIRVVRWCFKRDMDRFRSWLTPHFFHPSSGSFWTGIVKLNPRFLGNYRVLIPGREYPGKSISVADNLSDCFISWYFDLFSRSLSASCEVFRRFVA